MYLTSFEQKTMRLAKRVVILILKPGGTFSYTEKIVQSLIYNLSILNTFSMCPTSKCGLQNFCEILFKQIVYGLYEYI